MTAYIRILGHSATPPHTLTLLHTAPECLWEWGVIERVWTGGWDMGWVEVWEAGEDEARVTLPWGRIPPEASLCTTLASLDSEHPPFIGLFTRAGARGAGLWDAWGWREVVQRAGNHQPGLWVAPLHTARPSVNPTPLLPSFMRLLTRHSDPATHFIICLALLRYLYTQGGTEALDEEATRFLRAWWTSLDLSIRAHILAHTACHGRVPRDGLVDALCTLEGMESQEAEERLCVYTRTCDTPRV
jgi:hypothetical protein